MSQLRLPFPSLSPAAYQGLLATNKALTEGPLGLPLLELVFLRVSQINGCAFCLGKHSQTLRECEVPQEKLDCLAGWRISERFDARERAALAWTESVTLVTQGHVPDAVYEQAREQFSEQELIDLTLAIITINSYNRINVAFRTPAGNYVPGQHAVAAH